MLRDALRRKSSTDWPASKMRACLDPSVMVETRSRWPLAISSAAIGLSILCRLYRSTVPARADIYDRAMDEAHQPAAGRRSERTQS